MLASLVGVFIRYGDRYLKRKKERMIVNKTFRMVMWVTLGLCLTIPVALLSMIIGFANEFDAIGIVCTIGMMLVIADIGYTFITLPPSQYGKE